MRTSHDPSFNIGRIWPRLFSCGTGEGSCDVKYHPEYETTRCPRGGIEPPREYDMAAHPLSVVSDQDLSIRDLFAPSFHGSASDRLSLLAMFGTIYPGQEGDYADLMRVTGPDIGLDMPHLWWTAPDPLTGIGEEIPTLT